MRRIFHQIVSFIISLQLANTFVIEKGSRRIRTTSSIQLSKNPTISTIPTPTQTIYKNIQIASTCECGSDPDRPSKVNQDACFTRQITNHPYLTLLGVLDGHGLKGHVLNSFLSQKLPQYIDDTLNLYFTNGQSLKSVEEQQSQEQQSQESQQQQNDQQLSSRDIGQLLIEAFEEVNEEARLDTKTPAGRSGTTCVVSIFDSRYGIIYTANVGDSRAILGLKIDDNDADISDGDSDSENENEWYIQALSEETTTKREEERERIESSEGRIDGRGNVWYGPVGIAMTRSLGNVVMRRAGVIPTPEITIFDLNEIISKSNFDDKGNGNKNSKVCLIVLGTDGIFDVVKNNNVINFVEDQFQETGNLQISSDCLVKEAKKRWQAGLPFDVRVDDTTCVLLRCEITNH